MPLNRGPNTLSTFKLMKRAISSPFRGLESMCWNTICSLQDGEQTKEAMSLVPLTALLCYSKYNALSCQITQLFFNAKFSACLK